MSASVHVPMLERFWSGAGEGEFSQFPAVPVETPTEFLLLAREMVQTALQFHDGESGVLSLADGHTAAATEGMAAFLEEPHRMGIAGQPPAAWTDRPNVSAWTNGKCSGCENQRFIVLLSNAVALAAAYDEGHARGKTAHIQVGGWTAYRPVVEDLARGILDASGQAWPLPGHAPGQDEAYQGQLMRLMRCHHETSIARPHKPDSIGRRDLLTVLDILKAISAERRSHDILYIFVEKIAETIPMTRCSVVRIWGSEPEGHVLASHDDESAANIRIDLRRYPEVGEALQTRQKVVIEDTRQHPLTRPFASELAQAQISSLAVIPIVLYDPSVGSLLLRAARSEGSFTPREISFFEIVSEAASNALERGHLIEHIQRANERLEHLAITDGLTGLYNHRFFSSRLEEEIQRAKRYQTPLSCIFIDIDDFKAINDSFGHLTGDETLRQVAQSILHAMRTSDIVARYGGEEFTCIMPQTDVQGAAAKAEQIREQIAQSRFPSLPSGQQVTVSIGVGGWEPGNAETASPANIADAGLYIAKNAGKNQVVIGSSKGEQA